MAALWCTQEIQQEEMPVCDPDPMFGAIVARTHSTEENVSGALCSYLAVIAARRDRAGTRVPGVAHCRSGSLFLGVRCDSPPVRCRVAEARRELFHPANASVVPASVLEPGTECVCAHVCLVPARLFCLAATASAPRFQNLGATRTGFCRRLFQQHGNERKQPTVPAGCHTDGI